MNNKKTLGTIGLLALSGLSFVTVTNAQTISSNGSTTDFIQRRTKVMQNLTEAQKKALEQAKALLESGNKSEADALLKANNIELPKRGHGFGGKGFGGNHENKEKLHEAIANGDYQTFQKLASSTPLKSVDLNTFNLLTPQFKAKIAAQTEIKRILKAAGVEAPVGRKE